MTDRLKEAYCCCQIFPLKNGVFLIAVHSFLQGTYGILVVITSYYKKKDAILNIILVGANVALFPAGILVFATSLYDNYWACRISTIFFVLVTFFDYCISFCYIIWYNEFKANSELDKALFWRNDHDWVAHEELPFTIWHILAYSSCAVLSVWFYYSFQLWRFANLIKERNALRAEYEDETVRGVNA